MRTLIESLLEEAQCSIQSANRMLTREDKKLNMSTVLNAAAQCGQAMALLNQLYGVMYEGKSTEVYQQLNKDISRQ